MKMVRNHVVSDKLRRQLCGYGSRLGSGSGYGVGIYMKLGVQHMIYSTDPSSIFITYKIRRGKYTKKVTSDGKGYGGGVCHNDISGMVYNSGHDKIIPIELIMGMVHQ